MANKILSPLVHEQNMSESDEFSIQLRPMTAACTLTSRSCDRTKQDNGTSQQTSPREKYNQQSTIATKMSSLTLGTGKIIQTDHIDKLELHFDNKDFSSLITQRLHPSDRFSVIRENTHDHSKHTKLPKTFITRSGSLFLYSDSKIMKDKTQPRQRNSDPAALCMKGLRLTQNPDPRTSWKKYITNSQRHSRKTDMTCMCSTSQYHVPRSRLQGKGVVRLSHTRMKTKSSDTEDEMTTNALSKHNHQILSLDTVKELSNALLEYRLKEITDRERYENTVINTWGGTRHPSETSIGVVKQKLSAWTLDWLQTSRRRSKVQDQATEEDTNIGKHFLLLQRAKTDLSLASKGIVPNNTPISTNCTKGLESQNQERLSTAKNDSVEPFP